MEFTFNVLEHLVNQLLLIRVATGVGGNIRISVYMVIVTHICVKKYIYSFKLKS